MAEQVGLIVKQEMVGSVCYQFDKGGVPGTDGW